jgi:hypothetical protein
MVGSLSDAFIESLLSHLAQEEAVKDEDTAANTNPITGQWPPSSLVETLQESQAANSSALGSHKALHHTVMSSMANAYTPCWELYYGDTKSSTDEQQASIRTKEQNLEQMAIIADLIVGLFMMNHERRTLSTEAVAASMTVLLLGLLQACTTTQDKQQVMDVVKAHFVKYTKGEVVEEKTNFRKEMLEAIQRATSDGEQNTDAPSEEPTGEEGKEEHDANNDTDQQEEGEHLLSRDEAVEAANLIADL